MMRKAAAVVTAICCLMASQVYALGLGSLTLESSLNQPLRARVEIVDPGGVSPADIVVQMGSQQDFQRFNLERTNFFSDVDFTIESTAQGVFVLLTSNQSVREPYLSFILDTRWPSGRILSEHTVLLDLPVFSDARSIAEPINQPVSPVVETEPEPAADAEPELSAEPEPAPVVNETAVSENVITEAPAIPGGLEIQETDTLWEVAMRVRPDSSVTIQQTMLAIQRLNPDAFVGGNINRLRAGETLRIPDLSQVQSISQQQAVSEVTRQNQLADLNVQPLTAPASGPSSLASSEQQGQLRVLTAEEAEAVGSGASAAIEAENSELDARIEVLENQLALQEEESDRARLQQAELVARLDDLDEQIAAAMEIISLQDQQLAQLQQSLAEAAVQASLQQEQPVATVSESQPVRTAPPSFLDSVATVLNNNSLILIIVSVLVVLLTVMLLMRRNRAVTAEGLEVEFDNEVMPQDGPEETDEQRADEVEPDEETVLAVAGMAGTALASGDEDVYDIADTDEVVGDSDSEEAAFHDFGEVREELSERVADSEAALEEESLAITADEAIQQTDREEAGFADQSEIETEPELEAELEVEDVEITGINVPEEAEQAQVEETDELDEIVDFELDTEVDSAQEEDQSAEVVDFDIDEFLDEDQAAVEMQADEDQGDSSTQEQGIDFELDTDFDDEVEGEPADESTGIGVEEVEFTAESDSGEVEQIDIEQAGEADAELDIDTFALEDQETEDNADEDTAPGEQIESLDFDLSAEGIGDADDADGADLESVSDSEVETFDFELGAVDAEDELAEEPEERPEESQIAEQEQAAENLESVDFALNTEAEPEESPQVEEAVDEEIAGLEGVEFTPEDESEEAVATEAKVEDEAEAEAEVELEARREEIPEEEAPEEEVLEAEAQDAAYESTEADAEAGAGADEELVFEADEDSNAELAAELEMDAANEAAESPETIEVAAEDTDEIGEVLTQDEEAANPEAEVEMSDLDFFSTETDSAIDGAEQDSDLLSDDDEAATKLDLAYAYQKMGDVNGAKEILEEVLKEGNDAQVSEAKNLIEALQS